MWKIPLFDLNYDDQELSAAAKVIKGGWLTMGENINEFEGEFSKILGQKSLCTAVSSCTAALHMALIALEVKQNDEVIIPALTFVSDANVVNLVGGKVVLADCDSLENWNVSLKSIKKVVTKKTKAIIVVHFAGYPIEDINEISLYCKNRGISLIEDVAHAPGASINGRRCGSFGDVACFSFFSNKNLSVGEGGMAVTQNKALNQKLKYLRSHGMTSLTLDRHKGRSISYDVLRPGLNYRMDEIRAAIGIVQLKKLFAGNKQRGLLVKRYINNLRNSKFKFPFLNNKSKSNSAFHIFPVLLDTKLNRVNVITKLKDLGVQTSIHYPAFWDFEAYKNNFNKENYPVSRTICDNELTLPLYPKMSLSDVDYVCDSLKKVVAFS
ncbi:DegT/DnrJ/EryC1/StrS aminotransferase family protein [bacterium]|nr:DegT/DnrJ/EryC1/StrS aminotransferase family protein [bacterium]